MASEPTIGDVGRSHHIFVATDDHEGVRQSLAVEASHHGRTIFLVIVHILQHLELILRVQDRVMVRAQWVLSDVSSVIGRMQSS